MGFKCFFGALLLVAGTTSGASASTATSCSYVTLNNILNIGTCVGTSLDSCSNTSASSPVSGLVKLLNCTIQGIFQYGSPQGTLEALVPLVVLITNRLGLQGVNLPILTGMNLCGSIPCSDFFVKNDTCLGSIDIAVSGPQNISSCTGDVAMLCTAGSPTTSDRPTTDRPTWFGAKERMTDCNDITKAYRLARTTLPTPPEAESSGSGTTETAPDWFATESETDASHVPRDIPDRYV
ncbi:uncharacterized protein LOC125947714 [Dermacentor silvarum]|uniref:uncharacterized protein LOC125947714 n=1 Tax=Dermacentor silvarum TaxID=543639 RepID=UPI002100A39B|nr:uncharacterized protein LOC125947714 [Dermacentor silvarum]